MGLAGRGTVWIRTPHAYTLVPSGLLHFLCTCFARLTTRPTNPPLTEMSAASMASCQVKEGGTSKSAEDKPKCGHSALPTLTDLLDKHGLLKLLPMVGAGRNAGPCVWM